MSTAAQQKLREAGLKITSARIKVLELFEGADIGQHHMSAVEVFKLFRKSDINMGISTVHRVLATLETAGILKRQKFNLNSTVYELNNTTHHNHIVCQKTGRIYEFFDAAIENRLAELALEHGYELEDYSLVLYVKENN